MGTLSSAVFVLTMDFFGTESGREVTVSAPAPDPIAAATNDEVGHMMTVDTHIYILIATSAKKREEAASSL